MSDWLSPLNKLRIQRAITARSTKLVLDDNRVFKIDYNDKKGTAYLESPHNLVPRGYFSISKVTDLAWLSDGNK